MRGRLLLAVPCFLAILLFSVGNQRPAQGCAPVYPPNPDPAKSVRVANESAIIVWDAANKTQHFIRRASFVTQVPYFGFLVPTPSKPELAESPDATFRMLEDWTKPDVVTKEEWVLRRGTGIGCGSARDASREPAAGRVDILETKRVGGFDATVLQASDTKALGDWLAKHGYDTRPAVVKWLDPYVQDKWIITAFQIAKDNKGKSGVDPAAVRMSFKTEKPFFPYSEPADMRTGQRYESRLLRVFFVSDERVKGSLKDENAHWPGKIVWADHLTDERQKELSNSLRPLVAAGTKPPQSAWLTILEDEATPRPGVSDLYFEPAEDQSIVYRPPVIHIQRVEFGPPPDLIVLGMVVVLFIWLGVKCWRGFFRWDNTL